MHDFDSFHSDHDPYDLRAERQHSARCRHDTRAALRMFGGVVMASIPIWVLTPVIASFATLIVPHLLSATFAPTENNGSTSGDVPVTLYTQTAMLLVFVAVAVLILNLVLGVRPRHSWMPVFFGVAGVVLFVFTVITLGGAAWEWNITPVAVVAGAAASQLLTTHADARRGSICLRAPWNHR